MAPEPTAQSDRAETPDLAALQSEIDTLQSVVNRLERELAGVHHLATLGSLSGLIAHEINNLLTPVRSYAQMARRYPDRAELTTKALERAELNAAAATQVAEAILALAGGERVAPTTASANIGDCLTAAVLCLGKPLDAFRVTLDRVVPRDLHAAIPQCELQQVLLNLLLNAVRAIETCPTGSRSTGRIRVVAECSTWNTVQIRVEDNGPGIDPETLPTIFDAGVRGGEPGGQAETSRGAGLGLTVCRRLLEHRGGRISVESKPGEGAAFEIALPAA